MKKTNAQKEFEKEQSKLRNRIKRLEETGYEFENAIISMMKAKYKDLTPKAASVARIKMSKLNKEMLTQSRNVKSFTTKAGNKIETGAEFLEYKFAKEKQKKKEKNKKITEKELQKRFEELNEKNKTALSNFYKGLNATLESIDDYNIEKYRLLKAVEFMQKLSPGKQINILNYINKNTTEFMSTIWDSDNLIASDGIAMSQFEVLENKLKQYEYVIPSDAWLQMQLEKETAYLIYDRKFIRQNTIKKED